MVRERGYDLQSYQIIVCKMYSHWQKIMWHKEMEKDEPYTGKKTIKAVTEGYQMLDLPDDYFIFSKLKWRNQFFL